MASELISEKKKNYLSLVMSILLLANCYSPITNADEPLNLKAQLREITPGTYYFFSLKPVFSKDYLASMEENKKNNKNIIQMFPTEKDLFGYAMALCRINIESREGVDSGEEIVSSQFYNNEDAHYYLRAESLQDNCIDILKNKDTGEIFTIKKVTELDTPSFEFDRDAGSTNFTKFSDREVGMKGAILLTFALGTFVVLAVTNFEDPAGWVAATAVVAIIGVAGFLCFLKTQLDKRDAVLEKTQQTRILFQDGIGDVIQGRDQITRLPENAPILLLLDDKGKAIEFATLMQEYLFPDMKIYSKDDWKWKENDSDIVSETQPKNMRHSNFNMPPENAEIFQPKYDENEEDKLDKK